MNIVIIGTGNVAGLFSTLLQATSHRVVQVFGRNPAQAEKLAAPWQAAVASQWHKVNTGADLYLIALRDDVLTQLNGLRLPGRLVVHTAGAVAKEVLQPVSERTGVLYPLQSIRGRALAAADVPLLLEADTDNDREMLAGLAADLGCPWQYCTAADRKRLHLGAVWVNNFPNFLFSVAYRYCRDAEQDFGLLLPLIRETAARLDPADPWQWQTGPAMRHDVSTIETHLALLENHPREQALYRLLSEAISSFNPATE